MGKGSQMDRYFAITIPQVSARVVRNRHPCLVAEHDTFGLTRGAARVENRREIGWRACGRRHRAFGREALEGAHAGRERTGGPHDDGAEIGQRRDRLALREQRTLGHEQPSAAIGHHVCMLLRQHPRVERYRDASGGSDGHEHLHEFPRVRQEHGNAVALAQTERAQSRGGALHSGIEFPVREFAPASRSIEIDQRNAGRPSGGGSAQDEADVHSCPSMTAAMPHPSGKTPSVYFANGVRAEGPG